MHLNEHRRGAAAKAPQRGRAAFTLVELLVVIAIIAVMVALTTAAVMRFAGAGQSSATRTNLGKVNAKLVELAKGVTDAASKESLKDLPATLPAATVAQHKTYADKARVVGANDADPKVRAKFVELRLKQAFPTTFAEAFWPDPSWKPSTPQATAPNAWGAYVTYLAELGIRPNNETAWDPTKIPTDVQAAVCLLMILTVGPKGSGATGDELGSAVGTVQLPGVTATATPRGIVDAWHQPVVFTRQFNASTGEMALLLRAAGGDKKFNTTDDVVTP